MSHPSFNTVLLSVFFPFRLLSVHEVSLLAPIRTVTVTSKNTHILLGLNDGKLIILAVRPKS